MNLSYGQAISFDKKYLMEVCIAEKLIDNPSHISLENNNLL